MKLRTMIKRVGLLVVHVKREGDPVVDYLEGVCHGENVRLESEERSVEPESFFKKLPAHPMLVLFTGEGIITKVMDEAGEGLERITAGSEFLWEKTSSSDGSTKITFTRKEKVEAVLSVWEKQRIPVVSIHLSPFVDDGAFENYLSRFFQTELKWKRLAEPTERGQCLCVLLTRKLKLPVLIGLLFLLLVNYMWSDALRERHSSVQAELTRLERNVSDREKLSREVERVVNEYRQTGNRRNAFIVDRVASVVPSEIVLESVEISPLLKAYEEGKTLSIRDGMLRCKGKCTATEKMTRFIGELTRMEVMREVKLIALEQERETGYAVFKIEIRL